MSKYIIELGDSAKKVVAIYLDEGAVWTGVQVVEDLEVLNSDYINEHFGDLQDTAYQKGINDGSLDVKQRVEGAYQKGLDEAWKAARRISVIELNGGLAGKELMKIYGTMDIHKIYDDNTASEAIEKLKAYEKKQSDKIEVGDEVEPFYTDITGVVTLIDGDTIYVLWRDGSSTSTLKLKEVTKTGRHFDIASILEGMRND